MAEAEGVSPEEDASDEEQPEIEDEEMAEWGDVAESVGGDDPQDENTGDEDGGPAEPADIDPSKTSLGDVYCNALGMGAATVRDRYGDLDDDRSAAMDEYADMARQLDIDEYVDDWLDEQGGIDELSPGQGVAVMSVVFAVMVAVDDPSLAENALGGIHG